MIRRQVPKRRKEEEPGAKWNDFITLEGLMRENDRWKEERGANWKKRNRNNIRKIEEEAKWQRWVEISWELQPKKSRKARGEVWPCTCTRKVSATRASGTWRRALSGLRAAEILRVRAQGTRRVRNWRNFPFSSIFGRLSSLTVPFKYFKSYFLGQFAPGTS